MLGLFQAAGKACVLTPKTNAYRPTTLWKASRTLPYRNLISQSSAPPPEVSATLQSSTSDQSSPSHQSSPIQPLPSQLLLPKRVKRTWTAQEDALLIKLHNTGKTDEKIAEQLGRTWASIGKRLGQLRQAGDLPYRSNKERIPFSAEEDFRLLAARQQKVIWRRIAEMFPNRNLWNLMRRFGQISRPGSDQLPIPKGRFSKDDDAKLLHLRHHEGLGTRQIAVLMSRSMFSIRDRWRHLRRVPNAPFVASVAREYDELKRSGKLPDSFYGPTRDSNRWTPQERSKLSTMTAAGASDRDIAAALSRTPHAIREERRQLASPGRLNHVYVRRFWTDAETSKLLSMTADGAKLADIAQALSRTVASVKHQRSRVSSSKRRMEVGQPQPDHSIQSSPLRMRTRGH